MKPNARGLAKVGRGVPAEPSRLTGYTAQRRRLARPTRAVIGVAILSGAIIASFAFRGRGEPHRDPAAGTQREASNLRLAQRDHGITAAAGRADFQALLANLRAQNAAGADCLKALQRVAESQPALAIDLALALAGNSDERASWVTELTRTWAARDAQAAWDWLGPQMGRLESVAGTSLLGVVLNAMAANSPQRVIDNVDTLLRRGDIDGGIAPLVACQLGLNALLSHGDVDLARSAVEEWVRNPRAQAIDASAFNVVAGAIAQNSWVDAGRWLETLPPSTERNSALAVLASKWSDHDPIAALNWAETLGADHGQFGAIRTVFADWVERDGSRVGDWLLGYIDRTNSEAEVDQLIGSFVSFSSGLQRNPALALQWVGLLRDSAQREASAFAVIERWARRDLPAAIRYVDTAANLSAAQRQNIKAALVSMGADREPTDD